MFYEDEKEILKEMMDQVSNDIDKRENSSLVYNALAPTSIQLSKIRSDMDRFLNYTFTDPNIPDEYLDNKCKDFGIKRKKATYAVKLGVFKDSESNFIDIPLNSRFSINKIFYKAIEKIEDGKYKMECETLGTTGNMPIGDLLPVEYIEKLGSARIGEIISEGTDIENNLSLFNRLIIKVQTPATSGNVYDYLNWALSVEGVGNALIKPLWNGNGTVKVLITNSENRTPTEELVEKVTKIIEENRPIGATVTVVPIQETNITINCTLLLEKDYNIETIKESIATNVRNYFNKINLKSTIVRYNRAVNCILEVPGVIDYTEITINSNKENIDIGEDNIPILESVVALVAT